MQKISLILILPFIGFLVTVSLCSCTPTGSGLNSDGYSAPAPVSPVDRTESMRSEYRDQMR